MTNFKKNGLTKRNTPPSDTNNKSSNKVILPRLTTSSNSKMTSLLPESVQQALSKSPHSEAIVDTRREYAYKFLEEVFLPQVRRNNYVEDTWLVEQIKSFKASFQIEQPLASQNFALVTSVEAKLEKLLLVKTLSSETYDLVQKAYKMLRNLIDRYGNELQEV